MRDWGAKKIARRYGVDVDVAFLAENSSPTTSAGPSVVRPTWAGTARSAVFRRSEYLLEAKALRKRFGGVQAVRDVSFAVGYGETLGLIGPNGAGKTTTFELLAGFTKPDSGVVSFDGREITGLRPEIRARRGLIRSFQDAALFQTLNVTECVQLALERVDPTSIPAALAGARRQEKRKEQLARDWVGWMGLERYRSAQIQELSTGTRRIAEIACLVALEPRLLLLDEPSSGIAQRETEALGELIARLRAELGITLVIIEHDIPLVMGLSDRVVAMADGLVIASGTPDVVRNDPLVVEAFLGGSITAIERSGGSGWAMSPSTRAPRSS
jgi:ABC-type branched-subunit amino acid transport system ATPase component